MSDYIYGLVVMSVVGLTLLAMLCAVLLVERYPAIFLPGFFLVLGCSFAYAVKSGGLS